MNLNLTNKKALVTGSTAGIGFAIARELATEGAEVVINGRTEEGVNAAVSRLTNLVGAEQVSGCMADLATAGGCTKLIEEFPDVDILVNNLGIYPFKEFQEITDKEWFQIFEINVMSGVRLSRWYLPKMLQQDWGRIVFMSSDAGLAALGEQIHYSMTKSAQLSISRALAQMTKGTCVTVNSVLPGPTLTEAAATLVEELGAEQGLTAEAFTEKFFREDVSSSLLGRFITPEEIATLVAYLCSPLSSATNGAALRAEGGTVHSII